MCRSQGLEVGEGQRRRTPSLSARSAAAPSPPRERASAARTRGAAAARSATAHHRGRAANGPSRPCPRRRTGPASCPPSPRTPHADVLPRPATTRPSTRPTRHGSARPPTPAVTASAVCSSSHPSRPLNSTPAGKFDSLQPVDIEHEFGQPELATGADHPSPGPLVRHQGRAVYLIAWVRSPDGRWWGWVRWVDTGQPASPRSYRPTASVRGDQLTPIGGEDYSASPAVRCLNARQRP